MSKVRSVSIKEEEEEEFNTSPRGARLNKAIAVCFV